MYALLHIPHSKRLSRACRKNRERTVKKMKEGSMQTRLARFLHGYRETPGKDGQTPSQRLLGYTIRSRIDTLVPVPSLTTPIVAANPFHPGQTRWVKNHSPGDKWLHNTVKETSGHRLVHVSSPDGERLRRADQVRLRDGDSTRAPLEDAATEDAALQASPEQQPSVISDLRSTPAAGSPRKSSRVRRPPARLFFFYKGKGVLGK